MDFKETFRKFSHATSAAAGSATAFGLALASILIWIACGPVFHYSDTWQLVINTATTIITFLMVFLIQNAQNRDSRAVHLKLDELIRSIKNARNELVDLEEFEDCELERLQGEFKELHNKFHAHVSAKEAKAAAKKPKA